MARDTYEQSNQSLSFSRYSPCGEWLVECLNCGASEVDRPSFWGLTVAEWKKACRESHAC